MSIWRSAEPDQTILTKRSIDDENFLKAINPINENHSTLYIFTPYDKDAKNVPQE